MGGGLIQLLALGAQDEYLIGDAQVTYWKVVNRKHTNFSIESIEQVFNGDADFGKSVSCTISRNGDLIHQVFLQLELPAIPSDSASSTDLGNFRFAYTDSIAHAVINTVSIEIGGITIDKHHGMWYDIWNELTQTSEKEAGMAEMVGDVGSTNLVANSSVDKTYYVPLKFWFKLLEPKSNTSHTCGPCVSKTVVPPLLKACC